MQPVASHKIMPEEWQAVSSKNLSLLMVPEIAASDNYTLDHNCVEPELALKASGDMIW